MADKLFTSGADCKNATETSTHSSVTQLSGDLSCWFCHTTFEWGLNQKQPM